MVLTHPYRPSVKYTDQPYIINFPEEMDKHIKPLLFYFKHFYFVLKLSNLKKHLSSFLLFIVQLHKSLVFFSL